MKDGFVQQIGTPQEVFEHPSNLFVSGFIGTPTMNYFDGKLEKRDGKYYVLTNGIEVELSKDKQDRLNALNVADQEVTVGVRPDHLLLCDNGIKARVDVSELMGTSSHLHMTIDGKDVIVIVPTEGNAIDYMGKDINLTFTGATVNIFSKETEKNLEY